MPSDKTSCGISLCFLMIMAVTLIIACITYFDGCIPELGGMCPRYVPNKGTITGFYYKSVERTDSEGGTILRYTIFADVELKDETKDENKDNKKVCKSRLYSNRRHLPTTINANTTEVYDYKIGKTYDAFVLKEHQDWCELDNIGKYRANGICSIIMFAFFGGMALAVICVNSKEEQPKNVKASSLNEQTKKFILMFYSQDSVRPPSPKIVPTCDTV